MSNYLEIIFRSKFRLLALVILLPLAFSGINLYLWRSYSASEVVLVPDPSLYGPSIGNALGFDQYSTAGQNFARLFSNLLGTQTFNQALIQNLDSQGLIHSDKDRSALLASLSQVAVSPGKASSSSTAAGAGGGGGGANGDHIITVRYVCTDRNLCIAVLTAVLDTLHSTLADLRSRAAADARVMYQDQLKSAEADVARLTAAIQAWIAKQPKTSSRSQTQQVTDPVLTGLQHDLDTARKAVDIANSQLQSVDSVLQGTITMISDLTVVDGPKLQAGMYGINGLGSDNLKSDAITFAGCLAAAAIYLMLVAFMDRTVRDLNQIKSRLRLSVIAIPDYQRRPSRRSWRRAPAIPE